MLWAAKAWGADGAAVLAYATSADAGGDEREVVGYGAVAVTRRRAPDTMDPAR